MEAQVSQIKSIMFPLWLAGPVVRHTPRAGAAAARVPLPSQASASGSAVVAGASSIGDGTGVVSDTYDGCTCGEIERMVVDSVRDKTRLMTRQQLIEFSQRIDGYSDAILGTGLHAAPVDVDIADVLNPPLPARRGPRKKRRTPNEGEAVTSQPAD